MHIAAVEIRQDPSTKQTAICAMPYSLLEYMPDSAPLLSLNADLSLLPLLRSRFNDLT